MKIIFYQFLGKGIYIALAVVLLSLGNVSAQEKADLTPNLTINIKLNSALGEKETAFYSKIAQDIINQLPRELALDKSLVPTIEAFNKAHEHVNVVSYLPSTDEVTTDKKIQHFKIKFTFDENGATKPSQLVKDVKTVGLKKGEVVAQAPQQKLQQEPQKNIPLEEETVVENVAVAQPKEATLVKQAEHTPQKAEPRIAKAITPVKPPEGQQQEARLIKRQKTVHKVPTVDLKVLKLPYQADNTVLTLRQHKQLMAWVHKARQAPPANITFIVKAFHGPLGEEAWLGEERLKTVTALLRQQDVDLSRGRVTEIFIHTNNKQLIEIHPKK